MENPQLGQMMTDLIGRGALRKSTRTFLQGRIRDILLKIEKNQRSKFSEEIEIRSHLSVENVMPVNWEDHWPLEDGTIEDGVFADGANGKSPTANGKPLSIRIGRSQANEFCSEARQGNEGNRFRQTAQTAFRFGIERTEKGLSQDRQRQCRDVSGEDRHQNADEKHNTK